MSIDRPTLGFLGAGQMGRALMGGLIAAGTRSAKEIVASDPVAEIRERAAKELGVRVVADNGELVAAVDAVVLAVKPQTMDAVLAELAAAVDPSHLILSIAAGVRLSTYREALGPSAKLVRAMPNTPALVGEGITAWCTSGPLSEPDLALAASVFGAVGQEARVADEGLLDAVTGLSGSGPAYVFLVLEALSDAGVREGLPRDLADRLACQTVLGAATLARETGEPFGVLKNRVTSPGGTTIAGLAELERASVRGALLAAVRAATRRSRELAGDDPDR